MANGLAMADVHVNTNFGVITNSSLCVQLLNDIASSSHNEFQIVLYV